MKIIKSGVYALMVIVGLALVVAAIIAYVALLISVIGGWSVLAVPLTVYFFAFWYAFYQCENGEKE